MSRSPLAIGALTTLLMLGAPSCRRSSAPADRGESTTRQSQRPNIIFLTVDTLRADHMALYGYVRDTMPAIGAFAKTAVVFDNAAVPRGLTRPSYASMLTGLYPFRHGVHSSRTVLHGDLLTLPEILKSAGYHSAAFVSNFVMVKELSGFDQGFDVYDDLTGENYSKRFVFERTAGNTLEAIVKWLDSDPPQPFFLFTNFMDPHGPYTPPERFRALYQDNRTRILKRKDIPDCLYVEGQLNHFHYVDRYDAEIRYADEAIGRLIEELKRRGVWDESLVVFTADHGECLGQHGIFFEHYYGVWEETTHVPLAIRLPASTRMLDAARPKRVRALCSPMDLAPTALAYLELPCDVAFDGRSLLPLMQGVQDPDRALLLEFSGKAIPANPMPSIYALRTSTHKLIRMLDEKTQKPVRQALFDLRADRTEQRKIPVDADVPLHRQLTNRLDSMLSQAQGYELPFKPTVFTLPIDKRGDFVEQMREAGGAVRKTLTADQVERLRSLGYVQ